MPPRLRFVALAVLVLALRVCARDGVDDVGDDSDDEGPCALGLSGGCEQEDDDGYDTWTDPLSTPSPTALPRARRSPPPPRRRRQPPPKRRRAPPPRTKRRSPPGTPKSSPPPRNPLPTPSPASGCTFSAGDVTRGYSACYTVRDRQGVATATVYYALKGNTLSVAYKTTAAMGGGWAAWAYTPNGGMIGASTVFSQACGAGCAKPRTAVMNSYSPSQFQASDVAFSGVVAIRGAGGELAATFDMPWPANHNSIKVMLGVGPMNGATMRIHNRTPKTLTLTKATLKTT